MPLFRRNLAVDPNCSFQSSPYSIVNQDSGSSNSEDFRLQEQVNFELIY